MQYLCCNRPHSFNGIEIHLSHLITISFLFCFPIFYIHNIELYYIEIYMYLLMIIRYHIIYISIIYYIYLYCTLDLV